MISRQSKYHPFRVAWGGDASILLSEPMGESQVPVRTTDKTLLPATMASHHRAPSEPHSHQNPSPPSQKQPQNNPIPSVADLALNGDWHRHLSTLLAPDPHHRDDEFMTRRTAIISRITRSEVQAQLLT